jgi:hypothetical protein
LANYSKRPIPEMICGCSFIRNNFRVEKKKKRRVWMDNDKNEYWHGSGIISKCYFSFLPATGAAHVKISQTK